MIQITNVSFSYGEAKVLSGINLCLEDGRIYGLLGENGVGKTTLLSLLSGLKKPCEGVIDLGGHRPANREPEMLSSIYYLQDEVAPVAMTPVEYAAAYGKFWKNFSMDTFEAVMTEFANPMTHRMDKMSCGQLKKAYIAFALATGAKYLFLDEPTNGLDIPSKAQFRSAVMKHTSEDATIVISTHQVRDLENIIDPIIILDRNQVLLNATIAQITEKLYFDYSSEPDPNALYSEMLPGSIVQVIPNASGRESKVNTEALFNAVLAHKDIIKGLFR